MSISYLPKIIPGYRKEKEKKKIPWKQIFLAILFLAIFSGLIYLLFFSPVFLIKDVEISNASQVDTNKVLTLVKKDSLGQNIFFWNKDNAQKLINENYPLSINLLVYKGLPNTIKIVIQETAPKIDWQIQDKHYLVDEEGRVIREGKDNKLIKIKDNKNVSIELGQKILPDFFINFVEDFLSKADEAGLKIDHFEVNESLYDLNAITDKNIKLILSPQRNAAETMDEYKKTIEKLGQPKEYIDLRFQNRAFFK